MTCVGVTLIVKCLIDLYLYHSMGVIVGEG